MPEQSEHHQQMYSVSGRCKKLQVSTLGEEAEQQINCKSTRKEKDALTKKVSYR